MVLALTSCTPSSRGEPLFQIADDEMGIGVRHPRRAWAPPRAARLHGRHRRRAAVVCDLPDASGDKVVVMVNGLGATPLSELYLLSRRAQRAAHRARHRRVGPYVGAYCTALDTAGATLTLARVDQQLRSC